VAPLQEGEWYVALAITPNAKAVGAYMIHPKGRFQMTKRSWSNAFTLDAPTRLCADASVQIEVVSADGTSTYVPYPWRATTGSTLPCPSPVAPGEFNVVARSAGEWWVKLAITPVPASVYLIHPRAGRFQLTKQFWDDSFTLSAPTRLSADAAVQLEVVSQSGASTYIPYPWLVGTRRAMRPLAVDGTLEASDSSLPRFALAAICSTTLLAVVGVLVATRQRKLATLATAEDALAELVV